MSSHSPPPPNPGGTGQPARSQEGMPLSKPPAQPAPAAEHHRENQIQGSPTEPSTVPPSSELFSPSRRLDVRQRAIDPFILGVLIGAIVTILGWLLGLLLLTLWSSPVPR